MVQIATVLLAFCFWAEVRTKLLQHAKSVTLNTLHLPLDLHGTLLTI